MGLAKVGSQGKLAGGWFRIPLFTPKKERKTISRSDFWIPRPSVIPTIMLIILLGTALTLRRPRHVIVSEDNPFPGMTSSKLSSKDNSGRKENVLMESGSKGSESGGGQDVGLALRSAFSFLKQQEGGGNSEGHGQLSSSANDINRRFRESRRSQVRKMTALDKEVAEAYVAGAQALAEMRAELRSRAESAAGKPVKRNRRRKRTGALGNTGALTAGSNGAVGASSESESRGESLLGEREQEEELQEEEEVEIEEQRGWEGFPGGRGRGKSACVRSISLNGSEVRSSKGHVWLPCGLAFGASITVVGIIPTQVALKQTVAFYVELQGTRIIEEEDPPRIYHLNPRLGGDWSGRQVIEQNTCYRSQWGGAQRCSGVPSPEDEEKVDGYRRCEKWSSPSSTSASSSALSSSLLDQSSHKSSVWLQHLLHRQKAASTEGGAGGIVLGAAGDYADDGANGATAVGTSRKALLEWPFPLETNKLFMLNVQAGWEGFHVIVDGRHVSSFPYRTGYSLEEATAIHIGGDIEVQALFTTSLPSVPPPRTATLEFSDKLKAPPLLPDAQKSLFIGVLSSSNHFEERMALRKTWFQYPQIRSGDVVVRFFLALHPSKQVNIEAQKEAALYGDMVILPFMDRYDLVVLKTIAICEFGYYNVTTNYIMKADDDNFIRLDAVFEQLRHSSFSEGLYMGNINEFHKPLREGKWAVTLEEWPETNYPPYANGPGYIITRDVAEFVARMKAQKQLRTFKMEDVSLGMWVVQYGINHTIHYVHNWRFCQFGCMDEYITAHYQSPRQMVCLWNKLAHGEATCCNQLR